MSLRTNEEYQVLKGVLRNLQDTNQIKRVKNGQFSHLEIPQLLVGTFQMTKQGFGFVRVAERADDIFIAPRYRGMAVHGDTVEVSLFAEGKQKRDPHEKREGEIVRVVERLHSEIVGTLEQNWNIYSVIPDDARMACEITIEKNQLLQAQVGQKVVAKIDTWGKGHLNPQGHIVEVLGFAGEVSAEMRSVVREFHLPAQFPPAVLHEVDQIPSLIPEEELRRRADFRPSTTLTIDPEDAKDFDDALSLEELPDGSFRVGVHIADVSYYVREGSEIDQEALRRGTSVYLPTTVVPMLPEKLSSGLCSLRPHEDRLTHSILMTLTSRGVVKDYEILESVIRSGYRFTYREVQNILDGREIPSWLGSQSEAVTPLLRMMQTLSATLTKKRLKEGSIDFDSPEAGFEFDEQGVPIKIIKKERLESHRLVEEFMLLANRMIAQRIGFVKSEEQRKPFLYRIHESPDPDRIKELAIFVGQFGYSLNLDGGVSSKVLQKLLNEVRGSEEENVINEVALRSMAKAIYSEENIGHFGLAFDYYTHFTSPIRRYPDLVVHRLLKEYSRGVGLSRVHQLEEWLPSIAKQSSDRERIAMEAERIAVKVMQVEFMKRHLGDEFHGIISGVQRFGLFIEINELLVEGMVHVRDLEDDYYVYDEKKFAMIGRRTGKQYRLGDPVEVKVVRVNPEDREIDFLLLEAARPHSRRGRR